MRVPGDAGGTPPLPTASPPQGGEKIPERHLLRERASTRYTAPMALNAPALTETLIEAGINPSAARRVVDILERDHADLLTEAQLDRRLHEQDKLSEAQLDRRLNEQDRLIQARFEGVGARFEGVDAHFDGVNTHLDSVDTRIEDIRDQLTARLDSADTRFDKIDERFDKVEERLTLVGARPRRAHPARRRPRTARHRSPDPHGSALRRRQQAL